MNGPKQHIGFTIASPSRQGAHPNLMYRLIVLLLAFISVSAAGTNTYIVNGTGDGYWGSQHFTETTFTLTFTVDTATITHGTPCCASVYTTPSGTTASINITGFPTATLTGDQAIFVNNDTSTAGIWHYNDPEYLTVTNSRFATNDLSVPFDGYSVTGAAYSYATPLPLSTGDTLYFTSVHDVHFTAQSGPNSGTPSAVSVNPAASTMSANTTQTFSFVVSDTAGTADISGLNILFQDSPDSPTACWLYYQVSTTAMTAYHNGEWSSPVSGTLTGDACTIDTTAVKASISGNNLTLTLPIHLTLGDNNIWPIFLNAMTNEGSASGYARVGSVTVEDSGVPAFTLVVSPTQPQGVRLGESVNYTVNVRPSGGFNQPVTFSATTTASHNGNNTQLAATFDPPTVTGAGSTTMTVSTAASDTPDIFHVAVTGTSQALTNSASTGPVEASNVPPTDSISPNTGTGSSQTFIIHMTDRIDIGGVNLLIGPSLNGQNACWIFFDGAGIYLANDDGTIWTKAGSDGSASNSQCSVNESATAFDNKSDNKTLAIPITFKPAFAGTKTLFVRANNDAGFDTGYQARGGWTVP